MSLDLAFGGATCIDLNFTREKLENLWKSSSPKSSSQIVQYFTEMIPEMSSLKFVWMVSVGKILAKLQEFELSHLAK